MTGDPGFQVQAEAIIAHAGTVDDVAAEVAQGRSAASTVRMGRDAYGILCQLIPTLLDPIQEQVVAAMQEAADSLQRAADDLRATARDYTGSDDRTANVFRGGY
jgi:excreted virulence factor EspC (type VII ESX diderm)